MLENKITLDTKLANVKSVVPAKFTSRLEKLGILTVKDLLWHFPARYDDYSRVSKIVDLKEGQAITLRADVKKISVRRAWNRNMFVTEAILTDETGGITAVWFNQPFISRVLKEGMHANFAGKVLSSKKGIFLSNPSYEVLRGTAETRHTAGLIPVYPETRGLTSKGLRYLIKIFLDIISGTEDFIPREILEAYNLPEINLALKHIHFPRTAEQASQAQKRFSFEYLFLLQMQNIRYRQQLAHEKAPALAVAPAKLEAMLARLPFTLTPSQTTAIQETISDISQSKPMNRLLQGDVGSGKTVVAALAALIAAENGYQAVFMAPTEVLARQHFKTLTSIFKHVDVGIGLLTGSEARIFYEEKMEEKKSKAQFTKALQSGEVKIIVGTHALIAKKKTILSAKPTLPFSKLGLVIIDEQHRFGVSQRAALTGKKSGLPLIPHFLSMSATPIPRTLTLTVFGDLDLSTITELPKGRKAIVTKVVDPGNRAKAYEFIRSHIKNGRQAFFIYPRIEQPITNNEQLTTSTESSASSVVSHKSLVNLDKRKALWAEIKTVKEEFEKISKHVFPDLKVAMLHGKMKATEKQKTMAEFAAGKIQLLITTSVVEVGVDVPNATIMVIEGADRFGLAQLYQFRGRVGRGEHQSFCFLFTDSTSEATNQRLTALLEAKNGFELAEKDLEIRGPGEFLGERQTGMADSVMNALKDIQLIKVAQDAAKTVLAADPGLTNHKPLAERLEVLTKQVHQE